MGEGQNDECLKLSELLVLLKRWDQRRRPCALASLGPCCSPLFSWKDSAPTTHLTQKRRSLTTRALLWWATCQSTNARWLSRNKLACSGASGWPMNETRSVMDCRASRHARLPPENIRRGVSRIGRAFGGLEVKKLIMSPLHQWEKRLAPQVVAAPLHATQLQLALLTTSTMRTPPTNAR